MIVKQIIILSLVSSFLFAQIKSEEEKKVVEIGSAAASLLKSTLMGKMKKELKKKDKSILVTFCATQAQEITKGVNNLLPEGVKVKRVSIENRNKLNKASSEDIEHISYLKDELKKGKKVSKTYKLVKKDDGYKVYKPIMIKKRCLTCHGKKETMNTMIKQKIEKTYPDDKAFGYKVNDFRGAFVIDVRKDAYK